MSHQAQSWAVDQTVGDALAKAILMNLANRADETGHCFPGQARISADTEIKLRTVKAKLAMLVELGLISTYRRDREGVRLSNGYQLDMPQSHGASHAPRVGAKVQETVSQGAPHAPSSKDEPPEEPSDIYISDFGKFWRGFPEEGRQHASRAATHDEWSRLSEADQQAALASVGAFGPFTCYCRQNDWYHPKNPRAYLADRLFENYSGETDPGGVLIGRGSPEWDAWWPHLKPVIQRYLTKREKEFWTVPTAWPPGHEPTGQPVAELDQCA